MLGFLLSVTEISVSTRFFNYLHNNGWEIRSFIELRLTVPFLVNCRNVVVLNFSHLLSSLFFFIFHSFLHTYTPWVSPMHTNALLNDGQ